MTRYLAGALVVAAAATPALSQPSPVPPAGGGTPVVASIAAAPAVPAPSREARVFELRTYYAAAGKLDALHARFRDSTIPLLARYGAVSLGYWVPVDNPDNMLVYLLAYPSPAAKAQVWAGLAGDPEWLRAKKRSEAGGKLVESIEETTLTPTDYTPAVAPARAAKPRVFELRTYAADDGNLDALHARFRAKVTRPVAKHGVESVGVWSVAGRNGAAPALVQLVAHNEDSWEKSIAAVRKPDVRPDAAGGVQSLLLKPTDYSPLK